MKAEPLARYFRAQAGAGDAHLVAHFGRLHAVPFHRQKGYGLGAWLSKALSFLKPVLVSTGRTAARAGARVLEDLASGERDVKSSVKRHLKDGVSESLEAVRKKVSGGGKRRKVGVKKTTLKRQRAQSQGSRRRAKASSSKRFTFHPHTLEKW
jgi:hypothetical protein